MSASIAERRALAAVLYGYMAPFHPDMSRFGDQVKLASRTGMTPAGSLWLCLHGDLMEDRFLDLPRHCCHPDTVEAGDPPQCPRRGNMLRPGVAWRGVVWFGEPLPLPTLAVAQHAARQCALMLVVGTAGAVFPAAGLARLARDAGAKVVIVNPHVSELDAVADAVLRGTAAQLLPLLLAAHVPTPPGGMADSA
mgnify:CR=1 FL=1